MEKDDDESPDRSKRPRLSCSTENEEELQNTHDEAKTLFSSIPFKHRWVGFLGTVSSCLLTENGAIIPWTKVIIRDSIDVWIFFFLIRDAAKSTTQMSFPGFQIKETPCLLAPLNKMATSSKHHTTQLLMNYLRECHIYSTEFCNENREVILSAPYFICNTEEEANQKVSEWMQTKQGMKFIVTPMSTPVPDKVSSPDHKEKEKKDDNDIFSCMICMDATPSTCVRPCGHVVVCSSCSIGLRNTSDKGTCVRCRTRIESIEDFESGKVTPV